MQKAVNRISGNFPKIPHIPRQTGESTRSYIIPEQAQVQQKTPVAKAQPVVLRYYAIPVPEQKDISFEIEVANADAKIKLPKGSWGYCIIAKQVSRGESGELIFKQEEGYLGRVYVGKEYSKTELDFRIAKLEAQKKDVDLTIRNLEGLRAAMTTNNLERIVEVESGKKIGINDSKVRVVPNY